jgi:hypothetical protein
MRLQKQISAFWVALVASVIGVGIMHWGFWFLSRDGDFAIGLFLALIGFVILCLGFLAWIEIYPKLQSLSLRKLSKYELIPIYYSEDGPRKSDAVVCLARKNNNKEEEPWVLKIVPLSAFVPEARNWIKSTYFASLKTGEPSTHLEPINVARETLYSRDLLVIKTPNTPE